MIAARTLAYNYTNIPILIGIGIVAAFLFVVAVLGLIGTLRHNMIIMFFVSSLKSNSMHLKSGHLVYLGRYFDPGVRVGFLIKMKVWGGNALALR